MVSVKFSVIIYTICVYHDSCFLLSLQIREPFSIMSLVKSPMGLMMGFMLVVVFLMPKLMENMGKYSLGFMIFIFIFLVLHLNHGQQMLT